MANHIFTFKVYKVSIGHSPSLHAIVMENVTISQAITLAAL